MGLNSVSPLGILYNENHYTLYFTHPYEETCSSFPSLISRKRSPLRNLQTRTTPEKDVHQADEYAAKIASRVQGKRNATTAAKPSPPPPATFARGPFPFRAAAPHPFFLRQRNYPIRLSLAFIPLDFFFPGGMGVVPRDAFRGEKGCVLLCWCAIVVSQDWGVCLWLWTDVLMVRVWAQWV